MHGCTSGFLFLVNAEIDSMGGGVDDSGVGISSTPSLHQSSDLEKTQAELRQTFSAAEKFRRELEFLQKGGDPLDLKPGNAATVSFQSTSLTDRHPEQFVTSEAKGSFAITASPHGDSVESSGRLGAPLACEPNSADNLMLFDGDNKFQEIEKKPVIPPHAVLELPKKSYKRRIRSRPNRDGGARSSSTTDAAVLSSRGTHFLPFRHSSRDLKGLLMNNETDCLLNSNSNPKSPKRKENELDGVPAVQSTLGTTHGPHSAVLDANGDSVQNTTQEETLEDQPIKSKMASIEPETIPCSETHISEKNLAFAGPTNGFGSTEEISKIVPEEDSNCKIEIPAKILDDESSCTQSQSQRFDGCNGNGVPNSPRVCKSSVPVEQNLEANDLVVEKDDKILNTDSAIKEEVGPTKGSESELQNELKNSVSTKRVGSDGPRPTSISQDGNAICSKPQGSNDNILLHESQNNLKLANKEHEDSILEEARIIEAKRKRIAELSVRTLQPERRVKSQWDFVLEEMSWLANDFAQERLWKITAAAQICRGVAFASRARFQEQCSLQKQKQVAHNLAEAVMKFWQMIQMKYKDEGNGIERYGMRFLEYNNSKADYNATQAPATPDSIMDLSWEDNLTEENLFYTVPPGAIEAYRKAIESHLLQFEKTGSSMQDEVDTSGYDAVADNAFEEDEGETSTYYTQKNPQKRRRHFNIYGPRSYDTGGDNNQSAERAVGIQPSVLSGKRPSGSLNVSIPTKRMRTASRQRIISPFNVGTSGCIQTPNKTDASSGDTNSFQDELSSLHGGSHIPNSMEAESAGDYEKQLQFDSLEVSNRPKKKKKAKHPGSAFEHRWQLDSNFQNEQKDHSRRRLDTHQFESNGSSVASQMSNMSNSNKFMKLLVRDRGRKSKALKTPVGQPGSGSPWSLFEDQALVVLVHDMGPNWELISDAINSTLQFKCIFRKSKECKERHKVLMDRNGDGADSADDSGSSQPYPSTLPGIPEGSARQLFQRLQGPMEEDTLKTHFEKIIMIGQKQHYRKTHNDNQDPKQLQPPHSSHAFALSQVCPNNLNGGPILTPLELAEDPPDVPVGFQVVPPPMLPGSGSGPTSSAPGSSNSVHGTNLPSASAPLNPSARDGRYGVPRTGSLSLDDQQRMQHYNQMLSARNTQQSSLPGGSHSVTDRGLRMLPGGNGINRNMKISRPNYPPNLLNSATPSPSSMHVGPRPRDGMHTIWPNQNPDHQKVVGPDHQIGANPSFPNQISQQAFPAHRPISPHHFQGPPNPALGMRLAKERQIHQQRLLQQQFSTSNSTIVNPHPQPPSQDSQIPVSSPQSRSSSPQKPPVSGRVPQGGGGNQLVQRQQQRRQQAAVAAAKVMKGGGGSVPNGLFSKQSLSHSSSSLSLPHQQNNHGSLMVASSNMKLLNQKQSQAATTSSSSLKVLSKTKVNPVDQPPTITEPPPPMAAPLITVTTVPNETNGSIEPQPKTSETVNGSDLAKSPSGTHSGPLVDQGGVGHELVLSETVADPVRPDVGVQQQIQPPS